MTALTRFMPIPLFSHALQKQHVIKSGLALPAIHRTIGWLTGQVLEAGNWPNIKIST